jgi:hypothetical protein
MAGAVSVEIGVETGYEASALRPAGSDLWEESRLSLREGHGGRALCVVIGDIVDSSAYRVAPHHS